MGAISELNEVPSSIASYPCSARGNNWKTGRFFSQSYFPLRQAPDRMLTFGIPNHILSSVGGTVPRTSRCLAPLWLGVGGRSGEKQK